MNTNEGERRRRCGTYREWLYILDVYYYYDYTYPLLYMNSLNPTQLKWRQKLSNALGY